MKTIQTFDVIYINIQFYHVFMPANEQNSTIIHDYSYKLPCTSKYTTKPIQKYESIK